MAYGALYMVCCQAYVTICLFYNTTQQLSTRTDTVAQLSQKKITQFRHSLASFLIYFWSFQTIGLLSTIENHLYCIILMNSNLRPLNLESPPITICRLELPDLRQTILHCNETMLITTNLS